LINEKKELLKIMKILIIMIMEKMILNQQLNENCRKIKFSLLQIIKTNLYMFIDKYYLKFKDEDLNE